MARLTDLSGVGGRARPGIVHRLDAETSGLLVVAKDDRAHHSLQDQLRLRTLGRHYTALIWGSLPQDAGEIDAPLGRHPRERRRRAVVEGGRPARTLYRVEEVGEGASLLRVELRTGRTHQIRAHFHHLGHPLLGDTLYHGDRRRLGGASPAHRPALARALKALRRQALHAGELHLVHPVTGREMRFESPWPEDLRRAWGFLRRAEGGD
jgi:23S rRNA pseudouridine1911/1915/1917 synthase